MSFGGNGNHFLPRNFQESFSLFPSLKQSSSSWKVSLLTHCRRFMEKTCQTLKLSEGMPLSVSSNFFLHLFAKLHLITICTEDTGLSHLPHFYIPPHSAFSGCLGPICSGFYWGFQSHWLQSSAVSSENLEATELRKLLLSWETHLCNSPGGYFRQESQAFCLLLPRGHESKTPFLFHLIAPRLHASCKACQGS